MARNRIQLLSHQLEFLSDFDTRYVGLVTGYRGGKTYALCHKAVCLALKNPGLVGAICEPVFPMIEKILVPTLEQVLEETGVPFKRRKGINAYDILCPGGKKSRIWFLSAENYTRIAGTTLAWFCADEFDLIRRFDLALAAWNMLISRLTAGPCMQGCVTSTPEGFHFLHWFFEGEGSRTDDGLLRTDRRLIRGSTRDNPFISDDYVERLESQYPPRMVKAYIDGEFVNLTTGNVYYDFDRILNGTDRTVEDFPERVLHVGIDFNVGKMATEIAVVEKDLIHVVDEIYGQQNTASLITELKTRFKGRNIIIYCDGTGDRNTSNATKSDIRLLKDAGWPVEYIPGNPPILDRVGSVNSKIYAANGKRSLLVNSRKCPKLTRSLEQQGFGPDGKPSKASDFDHPPDALGYFIFKRWPITASTAPGQQFFHV